MLGSKGNCIHGPVTAKLCKSANSGKGPLRTALARPHFGQKEHLVRSGAQAVTHATPLAGTRDQLDRRSVKRSQLTRRAPPGLPPARMARTHSFAVTGSTSLHSRFDLEFGP